MARFFCDLGPHVKGTLVARGGLRRQDDSANSRCTCEVAAHALCFLALAWGSPVHDAGKHGDDAIGIQWKARLIEAACYALEVGG